MSFTKIVKGNIRGIGGGISMSYANGNNIKDAKPNWTIDTDGHGLLTGRIVFKSSTLKQIAQGQSHPADGRLKCFKTSTSFDADGDYTITADYIGLEQIGTSDVILSSDHSLSSVKIESHPDFAKLATIENGYDFNKKEWGVLLGGKSVDPKNLKGTTSYLAPEIGISGYFFSDNSGPLYTYLQQVGKAAMTIPGIDNGLFSGLSASSTNKTNPWLITGCSFEQYAHLYKIKFTARLSKECWNNSIYK